VIHKQESGKWEKDIMKWVMDRTLNKYFGGDRRIDLGLRESSDLDHLFGPLQSSLRVGAVATTLELE